MEMGTGLGTCWLQLPVVMACKALEQVCVYGTLCPVVRGCGMHWSPNCVAGTGTAVNEPPFSLWIRVSWGCWAQGKGVVARVLCSAPCQQLPHSALILGQIRIRDPNQGGKDITEEIMSGARTSSTPTPPQVSGPSDSHLGQREVHVALFNALFAPSGWKQFGAPGQWRDPPRSSYRSAW